MKGRNNQRLTESMYTEVSKKIDRMISDSGYTYGDRQIHFNMRERILDAMLGLNKSGVITDITDIQWKADSVMRFEFTAVITVERKRSGVVKQKITYIQRGIRNKISAVPVMESNTGNNMKKSELREIIREELASMKEGRSKLIEDIRNIIRDELAEMDMNEYFDEDDIDYLDDIQLKVSGRHVHPKVGDEHDAASNVHRREKGRSRRTKAGSMRRGKKSMNRRDRRNSKRTLRI